MPLTSSQRCETEKLIELNIRRYMEDLMEHTLPRIIEAAIAAHDTHIDAHRTLFKQQWSTLKKVIVAFTTGSGLFGVGVLLRLLGIL